MRYCFIDNNDFLFVIRIEEFYFLRISSIAEAIIAIVCRNRRVLYFLRIGRIERIERIDNYVDHSSLNHSLKSSELLLTKVEILKVIFRHNRSESEIDKVVDRIVDLLTVC